MEGAQSQPATGQTRIDLAHAKGQYLAASVAMPFETADRGPQRLQTGFFWGSAVMSRLSIHSSWWVS
ncbi:hypothetical protein RI056_00885 [Komagataeibacter nataicola]|nr:hypothetical protein [Komagataeibacter nataicola]WNM10221.1 hypothetical protein RI056_00885 [Komagataeibacter nataicola]